jgi:glutamate-1-semialdehyde 2,1-aminomutase
VYQAGTFSGSPIVMQAGLATLKNLSAQLYKNLNTKCDDFVLQMNNLLKTANASAHLVNYGSMISLRFRSEPVYNYVDAQNASSNEIWDAKFKRNSRKIYFISRKICKF